MLIGFNGIGQEVSGITALIGALEALAHPTISSQRSPIENPAVFASGYRAFDRAASTRKHGGATGHGAGPTPTLIGLANNEVRFKAVGRVVVGDIDAIKHGYSGLPSGSSDSIWTSKIFSQNHLS